MLDLNLRVVSSDSVSDPLEIAAEKFLKVSGGQFNGSGSSNSSIVNAETANDVDSFSSLSNHRSDHTFFNVFKNSLERNQCEDDQSVIRSGFVTKQLFPVSGGGGEATPPLQHQWLDLSSNEGNYGDPAEKTINVSHQHQHQHRQQVKKSRRGPRSKSSQYRGVTFYRRTGRWESHIWLVVYVLLPFRQIFSSFSPSNQFIDMLYGIA